MSQDSRHQTRPPTTAHMRPLVPTILPDMRGTYRCASVVMSASSEEPSDTHNDASHKK